MDNTNQMNVMVAVNAKYINYLTVLIISIFENNREHEISLYVLHSDLTEKELVKLENVIDRYQGKLRAIKIESDQFEKYPVSDLWSIETYFRLLAIELLPADMERVLYLDIDIAVDGSLSGLYHMDFEDNYFVVCEDNHGYIDNRSKNRAWNRREEIPYFNAGVMLYNLKKLKKDYTFKKFDQVYRKMDYDLEYLDQDLLNYIFAENVRYADYRKYNKMIRYGEQELEKYKKIPTVIYHYAASNKPWGSRYLSPFLRVWWDYARLAPCYEEMAGEFSLKCNLEADKEKAVQNTFREYYQLCIRWLNFIVEGGNVENYFSARGYKSVVLYGFGELGRVLYKQLRQSLTVSVPYVIDQSCRAEYQAGIKMYSPDQTLPAADVVVITPFTREEEIVKGFKGKGDFAIVSLKELMEGCIHDSII